MRQIVQTMLLVGVLPILLAACQTMGSGGTEVCAQWRSVSWSKLDTKQTIAEVKGNNARRGAWCR